MNIVLELAALALLIGFSALYSGRRSATGPRSGDLDARGLRRAAPMRWLGNEAALLVTILIGNNLALELATHVGEALIADIAGLTEPGALARGR